MSAEGFHQGSLLSRILSSASVCRVVSAFILLTPICSGGVSAQGLTPPRNVSVVAAGAYTWVHGVVNISWLAPSPSYPVDAYQVSVQPLDLTYTFDDATEIDEFIFDGGINASSRMPSPVAVANGKLRMSYAGDADQSFKQPWLGRGFAPLFFRSLPEGTAFEVEVDCTSTPVGASQAGCGVVVYHAGTGMPLFTWLLLQNASATYVTLEAYDDSFTAAKQVSLAAWPMSGVFLRVEATVAASTATWIVYARVGSAGPWAAPNVTKFTVPTKFLDSYYMGDLMYGVAAKSGGGSAVSTGEALFDNFRMNLPVVAGGVKDLYGGTDVCADGEIRAVNATTAGAQTSVVVKGLASNFPYTITVVAVSGAATSQPSAPIDGTFFWARNMPPRSFQLGAWYDSRWLQPGLLTQWPDASGRAHHLRQGNAILRPSGVRSAGYGSDFITPAYALFTRSKGTFMSSDSNGIDIGITGPMTIYWMARNRDSAQQILVGRGRMAQLFESEGSPGWALAIKSTAVETNNGFFGIKLTDNNGTLAGGSALNIKRLASDSSQVANIQTATISAGTSASDREAGDIGAHYITACRTTGCIAETIVGFDTAVNYSFSDAYKVEYVPAVNGTFAAMPPVSTDHAFRVGGPIGATGNPAFAYSGEIYEVLLYREAHNAVTRAAVHSWLYNYLQNDACPMDITSPGVTPAPSLTTPNACQVGDAFSNCNQGCASGYSAFFGLGSTHRCSNGQFNAPLICRRTCADVMAPIYSDTCSRRYVSDTFNTTSDGYWVLTKYITYPALPIFERVRVWVINATGGYLVGNTTEKNSCDRMRGIASLFGVHPSRWNSFAPPSNNLKQWARSYSMLADDASTMGIVIRLQDQDNHYRAEFTTTQMRIVRLLNTKATTLVSLNRTFAAGTFYDLGFWGKGSTFGISIGNATVLSTYDTAVGSTWGASGLYIAATSVAKFKNFSVDVDCDLGNVARYMYEGMDLIFACQPGYDMIGNTTWRCAGATATTASYGKTSLLCKSRPPIAIEANFSVFERSANNTLVGSVMALPVNLAQVISYNILRQYPANSTPAFSISGCSGALRVNDPAQLDYQVNPVFILTIFAWPDSQTISGVTWNVTITLENIPDPPYIPDATYFLNESFVGSLTWVDLGLVNYDRLPVAFEILGGTDGGLLRIDPVRGNMSVAAPGPNYAVSQEWQVNLRVYAVGVISDTPLETIATVTFLVVDLNSPPILTDQTFLFSEGGAVAGAYFGTVQCNDPDAGNGANPPAWSAITFYVTQPAAFKTLPSVVSVTADGTMTFLANISAMFDPVLDYRWFQGRKVRTVLTVGVMACDGGTPALCAHSTLFIGILSTNETSLLSVVDSVQFPAEGLSTQGNQLLRFLGRDFPVGGTMFVSYSSFMTGMTYQAVSCSVRSDTIAECRSVPGYGAPYSVAVIISGDVANSTAPLTLYYAAPTLDAVTVSPAGFTSAGSVVAGATISGANFGPPGTPIAIYVGSSREFTMTRSNTSAASSHTTIVATVNGGCGANLPVVVVIGGQVSTSSDPSKTTITYPGPTISQTTLPPSATYSLTSMSTLGSQRITIIGSSFGPQSVLGVELVPTITSLDATGTYGYTLPCHKDTTAPHTRINCDTKPGVGRSHKLTIGVCGQFRTAPSSSFDYAAPILTDVTGPGAGRASTDGGQLLTVRGYNFGPLNNYNDIPQAVNTVQYGTPGVLQYHGQQCHVTLASATATSELTCFTDEGTGFGHYWQMQVGGQWSNILPKNTSYGPPSISYFTGPGAIYADTQAGAAYSVVVNGINFGRDMNRVSVDYSAHLSMPRLTDGLVPGSPAGTTSYIPTACEFVTPHRALVCVMPPGGAAALTWRLEVDGQLSTAPTTSFAPPTISAAYLSSGGTFATTDGNDQVVIEGAHFGAPGLIQSVKYGPSGSEYTVTNFTDIDHTSMLVTLAAGIGAGLRFSVIVADQASDLSNPFLSYASPNITVLSPVSAPTEGNPARPVIVTVTGTEFGLLNPNVEVEVAFGNTADRSVVRLPVLTRNPSVSDVLSPTWERPASPVEQTVTFALPSGLGAERDVRLIQYLRGRRVSDAELATLPSQSIISFSYDAPSIQYVVVSELVTLEYDAATALFPDVASAVDLRKVAVHGNNFGPSAAVTGDSIVRLLQAQGNVSNIDDPWVDHALIVTNWTQRVITAFTHLKVANVRVATVGKSSNGTAEVWQVSQPYQYTDVSPQVSSIVGPPPGGFQTAGGEVLAFVAKGLASTFTLNVTVGDAASRRQCQLLNNFDQVVPNNQVSTQILIPQSGTTPPPDFSWTIRCRMPEGQGSNVPVQVWRDGLASDASITITYQAPQITAVGVLQADGSYDMKAFPFISDTVVVPTAGVTGFGVRIGGTNLGTCPTVVIAALGVSYVDACLEQRDAHNQVYYASNPAVRRSHTNIDFGVPEGEGSGQWVTQGGWGLLFSAGNQQANAVVRLRYAAPVIISMTPNTATTEGSTLEAPVTLLIQGVNFGVFSLPVVAIGTITRGWANCTAVHRISHYNLSCSLPAGSGQLLLARVTVADMTGSGGQFNYSRPQITRMSVLPLLNSTQALNASYQPVNSSLFHIEPARGVGAPRLRASPHGHVLVVVEGRDFGALEAGQNCVFLSWSSFISNGGQLQCNNVEDVLGEGEVPVSAILLYSHRKIVFQLQPGAGIRHLTLRAGGQSPSETSEYANFEYLTPILVSKMQPHGRVGTEGGDLVDLLGFQLPLAPINNGSQPTVAFPAVSVLLRDRMWPTEHVRINFGAATARIPCIASALDANGQLPTGFASCMQNGIVSRVPNDGSLWDAVIPDSLMTGSQPCESCDFLTFRTPPGVGVNKSMSVSIVAAGETVQVSNVISFSYDPPELSGLEPSPMYDDGKGGKIISLRGNNFGRLVDVQYFTPEEAVVEVRTAGMICGEAQRVIRADENVVQCKLGTSVPVGYQNVTIAIAGQVGFAPRRSRASLLVVCLSGYFGHTGEACAVCPVGATCEGFVADSSYSSNSSGPDGVMRGPLIDVSAGPVLIKDMEYDLLGIHTYPRPIETFFNLNGTMKGICPDKVRAYFPTRDICIVGCLPKYACQGDNVCTEGYTSKPPMYRCADCAAGYYKQISDCIKCPDSPAMVFIGFGMLIIGISTAGYFLNKYNFDIRVVSIGIDFFQVLAIFANAKVDWPPIIKEVYHILSAFNLNIEIVAPECLIPDVSFKQKFYVILAMPFAILVMFLLVNSGRFLCYRYVHRQKNWREHIRMMASSISILLLLLFLVYLYVTKTILSVFECSPTDPDDGQLYLSVVFEPCGLPGGTQVTVMPFAIIGIAVIIMGYPLGVLFTLQRNKLTVMEDQLLRALELPAPADSDALLLRTVMGRTYYQFTPDFAPFWLLAILMRKFLIAFSSLMFARNSAFQMAMCLLVMFVAYALQVRYRPYMPASEFDLVIAKCAQKAESVAVYSVIRARIMTLEARSKKKSRRVGLTFSAAPLSAKRVSTVVTSFLLNYNTVEAVLLFSASIVCLLGIMYEALKPTDSNYSSARNGVTYSLMIVIIGSIAYYLIVLVSDLTMQYKHRRERAAPAAVVASIAKGRREPNSNRKLAGMELFTDAERRAYATTSEAMTNPLFMRADGSADLMGGLASAVESQLEPPNPTMWGMVRTNWLTMSKQTAELTKALNEQRVELGKLRGVMDSVHHIAPSSSGTSTKRTAARVERRVFNPTKTVLAPEHGGNSTPRERTALPSDRELLALPLVTAEPSYGPSLSPTPSASPTRSSGRFGAFTGGSARNISPTVSGSSSRNVAASDAVDDVSGGASALRSTRSRKAFDLSPSSPGGAAGRGALALGSNALSQVRSTRNPMRLGGAVAEVRPTSTSPSDLSPES